MVIPKQLLNLKFCRVKIKSKAPFEKDWNNKPYSYEEISKFFPKENYGVLCGHKDLAVIDCDNDMLSLAVSKVLPKTFSVKTGSGGMHFYYFIPELKKKIILNADEEHLGEIQSYGTQVIGCGSLHPSGNEYRLINNVGIKTIGFDELKKYLGKFMKEETSFDSIEKKEVEEFEDLIIELVKKWKEGDRQELALSTAGYLRKEKRLGVNKVKQIITKVCEITEDEELDMRLRAVVETYKKDEKDVKGFTGLKKVKIKKNVEELLIIKYDDEGKVISRKVDIDKVAEHLTSKYFFKTLYGEKTEKIKMYDGKIFSGGARGFIKAMCENLLKVYSKKNVVEEIFDKIKRKTKVSEEEFYETDLNLIPLENGCYNVKTKKLEPHSPENNFSFYSPVKYNSEAECKKWFGFLNEALYPQDIPLMKQWFGFNLFRQYFIKKALILLGKKNTGKTILLDMLIYFVGEKNKCGLSLQKISSGSDFTKFALKDKLSNIYDDLSSSDINDGGAFKIATGGGYISAEEKFGEFVQFKTFAKISLAGNKAPPVKDNDDSAYFDRFMPIIFENVPEKIDPFLRDKLQTEKEMSGILNWALEGLHEILEKGSFDFEKTDEDIKKIMEMSGDILIQFGVEVLEQSEDQISKDDMYKIYCIWANANDKPILSKEQLGRRLNQKVKYLVPKNDAKKRFWDNVKIKNKWVEKSKSKISQNNLDTLHTFPKTIRKYFNNDNNKNNNILYIKSGEASKVSLNKTQDLTKKFTDEEIKQAGYTREELKEITK